MFASGRFIRSYDTVVRSKSCLKAQLHLTDVMTITTKAPKKDYETSHDSHVAELL